MPGRARRAKDAHPPIRDPRPRLHNPAAGCARFIGAPLPSIYGGTGAKGANSINVSWKAAGLVNGISYGSFGSHRAEPGLMQIFTVCTSSQAAQSEIEYYERYHSHVAGSAA